MSQKTSTKQSNLCGIFIFRRDFRIHDNTSLFELSKLVDHILPIFIFNPNQITNKNKYKSDHCITFMINSLKQLKSSCSSLSFFYGNDIDIIKQIHKTNKITHIAYNIDYTPFAINRDSIIDDYAKDNNINIIKYHDYCLNIPGSLKTGTNKPYQKFTPYYNNAIKHVNKTVNKTIINNFITPQILNKILKSNKYSVSLNEMYPSSTKDMKYEDVNIVLNTALKTQNKYSKTRNDLSYGTSMLSAYIKFGCVSIREVFNLFKSNTEFLKQLIWRDFYTNIMFEFPKIMDGKPLKESYQNIKWNNNSLWFSKWCKGETGFPIVDAGMRQLNQTGYMHNRARLITACFLIKTLLIDWRKGEQYFATKLKDYDPAVNNGNWQWVASTGADSQPYFRIFNPWLQTKEYDPECKYIKQWIPELSQITNKDILNWNVTFKDYNVYLEPICDYSEQKTKSLEMYSKAFM
jgi:deoxyribodipyrimidine photo-lyase